MRFLARFCLLSWLLLVEWAKSAGADCAAPGTTFLEDEGSINLYKDCHMKQLVLDLHNAEREKVASGIEKGFAPAYHMMELRWNFDLERIAIAWARRCVLQHNDFLSVQGKKPSENFSWWRGDDKIKTTEAYIELLKEHVDKFVREKNKYTYGKIDAAKLDQTGRFTVTIWAETREVGCGQAFYMEDGKVNSLFVCNYVPAGNVPDKEPYQPGHVDCQAIGVHRSTRHPHLCSVDGTDYGVCLHFESSGTPRYGSRLATALLVVLNRLLKVP